MLPPVTFVTLDDADRHLLANNIRHNKRIVGRNKLLVSVAVLMLSAIGIANSGLTTGNGYLLPASEIGLCISIPALALIVFINIVMLLSRLPPLYRDRKNGRKLRIPFHPYPYCIPELGKYYVKTFIKSHPFFPVTAETYYWINSGQVLFLEMAPSSKLLFDIKAEDELYTINVDHTEKTPSEAEERIH